MFSDQDKSSELIFRRSFEEKSSDISEGGTLKYAALYEELMMKRELIDKLGYVIPVRLPIGKDGVVNVRTLLPYDGTKFINMAYMTILGRVPEKNAVVSLKAALSADSSKEAKLARLKAIGSSHEAKMLGAVLTGFDSVSINEL